MRNQGVELTYKLSLTLQRMTWQKRIYMRKPSVSDLSKENICIIIIYFLLATTTVYQTQGISCTTSQKKQKNIKIVLTTLQIQAFL